jgi:flavin reductase (DIM6/NTAB) family NADH-FMN oxidoreductase RutF
MITFDLTGPHREDAYLILAGLVIPRPIALVTTLSPEGIVNAAPFSFFNVLGDSPPIIGFCPGDRATGVPKDTVINIRQNHAFVVNLVDAGIAAAMNACSAALPYGVSELAHAGLTPVVSERVPVPRIQEAPASLECKHYSTLEIGENRLIIGEVLCVHVKDGIMNAENFRVDPSLYQPVGRMQSPHWYCHTTQMFEMPRP